ncbi:MAG: ATPase [Pseudomonadota bacterium]
MENILKQLLTAELKAQAIVKNARQERERILSDALQEVKRAEQRFDLRIPEIQAAYIDKAKHRAQTQISELERRYQERRTQLIQLSERHQQQAVEQVLDILLHAEHN